MKTRNKIPTPAPTAISELAFNEAASFLYLADIMDKFWALLSSSEKRVRFQGRTKGFAILNFTREHGSPLQDIINILHHNALNILKLGIQRTEVPMSSIVHIRALGLLDVCV
jgi:hypothetical protein